MDFQPLQSNNEAFLSIHKSGNIDGTLGLIPNGTPGRIRDGTPKGNPCGILEEFAVLLQEEFPVERVSHGTLRGICDGKPTENLGGKLDGTRN